MAAYNERRDGRSRRTSGPDPRGIHSALAARPAEVLVIDTPAGEGFDRIRRFVPPAQWKRRDRMFDVVAALHEVAGTATLLLRRLIDLASNALATCGSGT